MSDRPRALSLFSGIDGLGLAAEAAGFRVVGAVEIDAYCRQVLRSRDAGLRIKSDIRKVKGHEFGRLDLLFGGFPCQDISVGNRNGKGIREGQRSGLWYEFARLIRTIRPGVVVLENVPAITARGLDVVLGDLAAMGYDATWGIIPAEAFGSPQQRARWFCIGVANTNKERCKQRRINCNFRRRNHSRSRARLSKQRWQKHKFCLFTRSSALYRKARAEKYRTKPRVGRGTHGNASRLFRHSWPATWTEAPHQEEAPRMAQIQEDTRARIRALGNSVVPQQALPWMIAAYRLWQLRKQRSV